MTDFKFDEIRVDIGHGVDINYNGQVDVVYEDCDDFGCCERSVSMSIEDLERILDVARSRRAAFEDHQRSQWD